MNILCGPGLRANKIVYFFDKTLMIANFGYFNIDAANNIAHFSCLPYNIYCPQAYAGMIVIILAIGV